MASAKKKTTANKKTKPATSSEYLPQVFEAEDVELSVNNAFCFSGDAVFMLLEASSDDEDQQASALVKVSLGEKKPVWSIVHEFNSGSSDYCASHPELHHILASGGYIHRIENGEMTFHQAASEHYLQKLSPIGDDAIAVFGDEGEVFEFRGGTYTPIATGTEETLRAMHVCSHQLGFVGGDRGTLLEWDGAALHKVELGSEDRIGALHVMRDGPLLLGCADGVAIARRNGKVVRMKAGEADLTSVTAFKGAQYWGDDDHGVYVRKGDALVPGFPTEYAFTMNATDSFLTINAGYSVYVYDGVSWVHLKVNPDMDRLVERAPVDF